MITNSTGNQTIYDINTGITVSVENRIKRMPLQLVLSVILNNNGFLQSIDTSKVTVTPASVDSKYYSLTSTSATNAGEEITVTASADDVAGSPL